jgi:hypothetical protein
MKINEHFDDEAAIRIFKPLHDTGYRHYDIAAIIVIMLFKRRSRHHHRRYFVLSLYFNADRLSHMVVHATASWPYR